MLQHWHKNPWKVIKDMINGSVGVNDKTSSNATVIDISDTLKMIPEKIDKKRRNNPINGEKIKKYNWSPITIMFWSQIVLLIFQILTQHQIFNQM